MPNIPIVINFHRFEVNNMRSRNGVRILAKLMEGCFFSQTETQCSVSISAVCSHKHPVCEVLLQSLFYTGELNSLLMVVHTAYN
jgi:hypothetical protein